MSDLDRDTATATCPRPDALPSDEKEKKRRIVILTNSLAWFGEVLELCAERFWVCLTNSTDFVVDHIEHSAVDLVLIDTLTTSTDEIDQVNTAARSATPRVKVQSTDRTIGSSFQALLEILGLE